MQLKFCQGNHYSSMKMLHKSTSMPSFTETSSSSSNSIDPNDDHLRKQAIKLILSYNKKVSKETQYLAISYLNELALKSTYLTEESCEKIAVTLLLLASKMNEIYPPKITSLIARCQRIISKEEIIDCEAQIAATLNYEIALENTPYTLMCKILGQKHSEKLGECQKLLRIILHNREINEFGDQVLALAIVYLIIPQFVKEMKLRNNDKVKTLAIKIYNLYQASKEKFEREKENRGK